MQFDSYSPKQLWIYGAKQSVGIGFLAGSLELTSMTARLALPLSPTEIALLGLVNLLVMGGFAGLLGLFFGFVQRLRTEQRLSRRLALHLSVSGLFLTGYYLWQGSITLFQDGRTAPAVAMALLPVGFSGVVFYNAAYWFRKVELGGTYRMGWLPISFLFSTVVALIAGIIFHNRDTGGEWALEGDKNVLIISIDTLRRDHVGVFSDPSSSLTPHIDALASRGIQFSNAITPVPETAPAHASLFTGLHPLRHRVLSNGSTLSRGYQTFAEVLQKEGYATGAFVSSYAVHSGSGLNQGFLVYDDDFTPGFPGALRIDIIQKLATAWMILGDPARTPWLFERKGSETVDRFEHWLDRHKDYPFLAWVHLFEPHAPYDGGTGGLDHRSRMDDVFTELEKQVLREQYANEVRSADKEVGRILSALDERGLTENTLIIFVSDHGEMLGEHGYEFNHFSLYDEVIRIPMIVVPPGLPIKIQDVNAQVRLMDVPATVMDFLQIDAMEETEGVELIGYGEGHRKATMSCSLLGREGRDGRRLLGLRNNGVKYISTIDNKFEELYNLDEDPGEKQSLVEDQGNTLEQARGLVGTDIRALERIETRSSQASIDSRAMLRALGYIR